MKVLYICNFESPYITDFWNELAKDCDLTVVFCETKLQQQKNQMRNEKWFQEKKYKFKWELLKQIRIFGSHHLCFDVVKYIKKDFDIVVFHPYSPLTCLYGIWYCILKKIPYLINSDGGFAKNGRGMREKIKEYVISHAEGCLSTSQLTDDYLAFYGGDKCSMYRYTLTPLYKKDILNNLISDDEKKKLREKYHINEEKMIVSVGSMIPRKGFDILLRASRNFASDIGVYIIGGNPSKEIECLKWNYNLENVHFIDFLSKDVIREYYKAADIFILPTREDVWGLVINEAMSCGLPIITTNKCIAGIELVHENINGNLVDAEDDSRISELVSNYFLNCQKLHEMSMNSLEIIKIHTIENMAIRHIEIFNIVIERRKV